MNLMHLLSESFKVVYDQVRFDPRRGCYWDSQTQLTNENKTKAGSLLFFFFYLFIFEKCKN